MNTIFQPLTLSVSELNALAKKLLEDQLSDLWISGEISNLTQAASGHYYFILKDSKAQVRCVLFKSYAVKINNPLQNGMHVELTGNISLYEARGEFQITVTEVQEAGLGKLFAEFTRLKNQLQEEGLFDPRHKQAIPQNIKTIGIVTSPAAAALRDIISTLKRRMNNLRIILYPTSVQGTGSEKEIATAINIANQRQEVDILLVCRGGGSIEDLWAFNEEIVARSIFASKIPIISGIGHETDFTIADFVADIRAPTPTAAAELASPDQTVMLAKIQQLQQFLYSSLEKRYFNASQQLDWLSKNLQHPKQKIKQRKEQLQQQKQLLDTYFFNYLKAHKLYLQTRKQQMQLLTPNLELKKIQMQNLQTNLNRFISDKIATKQNFLQQRYALLEAIAPQNILSRGYSIIKNQKGQIINSSKKIRKGENIKVILSDGTIHASVYATDGTQEELNF